MKTVLAMVGKERGDAAASAAAAAAVAAAGEWNHHQVRQPKAKEE